MSDLNTLTLQGRIVRDAVLKETKGGNQVALFTLAVNQTKKDAEGNYIESSNFFPVSVFVRSEKFASHLKKGQPLILEGYLKQVAKAIGTDESGKTRYDSRIYIRTSKVHFIWTGKGETAEALKAVSMADELPAETAFDEFILDEAENEPQDVFIGDDTAVF